MPRLIRNRKRRMLFGALIGMATTLALVVGLGVFAGAGAASSAAKPKNTSPPTISGTAQENDTLTADRGNWSEHPTDYNYFWTRCDKNGGSCSNISGANSLKYTLTSVDVGNTLRFRVRATNNDGRPWRRRCRPRVARDNLPAHADACDGFRSAPARQGADVLADGG